MRWNHPTRGFVPPADFIALAEETGLIVPIGEWVLRQACMDAANWPEDMRVAINLSPIQFRSEGLTSVVVNALAAAGLPAHRLELEITENVMLGNSRHNIAMLERLRMLGVRISLDDFGTGFSGLGYFRAFQFDKVKIDQCFVREMMRHPESLAIVRAAIGLGVNLGISTTAEGVESIDQLDASSPRAATRCRAICSAGRSPPSLWRTSFARSIIRTRSIRRRERRRA